MKEEALSIADEQETDHAARHRLREYLQHVILRELFELDALEELVFHGGTALRFLHGLDRFTEGLDFHAADLGAEIDLNAWLEPLQSRLEEQGYELSYTSPLERPVQSSFVRCRGLLREAGISHREHEKLSIKLEVVRRPPAGFETETSNIRDVFSYVVHHHDRPSFMAGKLHAILQREWTKGRDFYDLMFCLTNWPDVDPNVAYLHNALQQTDWTGPEVTEDNWRDVLAERVETTDWKQVREDVEPLVPSASHLEALEPDRLLAELKK